MFSFSLQCTGTEDPEYYSVRLPIQVHPSDNIELGVFSLLEKEFEVSEASDSVVIHVSSFKSQRDAIDFTRKFQGSLLFTAVERRMSLKPVIDINEPNFFDDPINISEHPTFNALVQECDDPVYAHGHFNSDETVIFKNEYNYLVFGASDGSLVREYDLDFFKEIVSEGLDLDSPNSILYNDKIKLAIRLYTDTLYMDGKREKFIQHITVLESLTERSKERGEIIDALDYLKSELKEEYSESAELVDAVSNKLGNDKEKSISSKLRILAKNESDAIGESEDVIHDKMNQAYKVRSDLVHEGKTDENEFNESYAWLSEVVPIILRQRAMRCATSKG